MDNAQEYDELHHLNHFHADVVAHESFLHAEIKTAEFKAHEEACEDDERLQE